MTRLKELYLADTRITDARLAHFNGLAGPTELRLYSTRVAAVGTADLEQAAPKVKVQR